MVFNLSEIISNMSNSSSPFDEGTGEFLVIDIEKAKKDLKLSERSIENGKNNTPRTTASKKDAMAAEIDTYINHWVSLAKGKLLTRSKAIDELNRSQSGSLQSITEIFETAKSELKTKARDSYNALFTAKRDWVNGELEYTSFREENKRLGPARYPAGKTKIFGLIFLIFLIEVMTNAYALGETHPSGPVGVVLEIFMFGIANLLTAFLLGNSILRNFNHVKAFRKIIGTLFALPMIVFIIFLNFFLAHYRDAISKLSSNELTANEMFAAMGKLGGNARDTLLNNPFMLDDFKSYLLLFVGLIASIIAAQKSYELDDPYPGYGKLSREQDELAAYFNDEQTQAFEDLNEVMKEHSEEMINELNSIKNLPGYLQTRESDKKDLYDKYNNWLVSANSVGEALYAFYREENVKARKQKKEPRCFNETSFSLNDDARVIYNKPKKIRSNLSSIEKTTNKYLDELNRQSEKFQNIFKDIENMSPDSVISKKHKHPTVFKD